MGLIKSLGKINQTLSKEEIIELGEADAKAVIADEKYDLFKVYVEMKRYEIYMESIMGVIRDKALEKASDIDEKIIKYDNAKITIMERRVFTYNNDSKWTYISNNIKALSDLRKVRENLLKSIAPGTKLTYVDPETGELEELDAPNVKLVKSMIVKL